MSELTQEDYDILKKSRHYLMYGHVHQYDEGAHWYKHCVVESGNADCFQSDDEVDRYLSVLRKLVKDDIIAAKAARDRQEAGIDED